MLTIHVNQIGFRPDDPLKRAVMPVPAGHTGWLGGDVFNVTDVSRLIREPMGSAAWLAAQHPHWTTRERTPLGEFVVCDFSDLTDRGGYQIQSDAARSYPFLIYRDAWKRCFRLLLEWYRIEIGRAHV
jgi:endoglucanase